MYKEERYPLTGLTALPHPVALVVGGGGCLGAVQVGIGLALEEAGFVPDLIVGTSVGALNGAIVAAHPGAAAPGLANLWTHAHRGQIFPLRSPGRNAPAGGVFSSVGLRRLIAQSALPSRLEDLPVPFTAIATDLASGAEVALTTGDLESALVASTAVPGLLPPIERDGHLLVDGGVVAYVPVLAALRAGAASMLVVSTGPETWTPPPRPPRVRATSVAARALLLLLQQQIGRDLQEVSQHVPTVVMPTGVEDWPQPWDFTQSDRLIATARAASTNFLAGLQASVEPGLYRGPTLHTAARADAAAGGGYR